jgi:L-iditol 2-dehydrogenase
MKAFVYRGDRDLQVTEVPYPRLQNDNAIVKIIASSICGTDLRTYRFGDDKITVPRIIGHEACGVVEEVGAGVHDIAVGEKVIVAPAVGCGECPSCRKGATNMCYSLKTIGFEYEGTFCEYMEIPAQAIKMGNVVKVDSDIAPQVASIVEPIACCVNGQSYLDIKEGDSVLIFGAGFIGCMHAEIAHLKGAARVIMADIAGNRLETAKHLVPEVSTVNSAELDVEQYIRSLTDGWGIDVVISACPDGATHALAQRVAAKQGRISLFGGIPAKNECYLDSNLIHYNELSVYGSHGSTPSQNKTVLGWISEGRLSPEKYISLSCPLTEASTAFQRLTHENMLKVVLTP